MARQIEDFDVMTTEGFEELFHLVKVQDITVDEDVLVILFNRLNENYPRGTWDRRQALKKLAGYIAMNWCEECETSACAVNHEKDQQDELDILRKIAYLANEYRKEKMHDDSKQMQKLAKNWNKNWGKKASML